MIMITPQTTTVPLAERACARITHELDSISAQTKTEGSTLGGEESDQLRRKEGQPYFLPRVGRDLL